MKKYILITGCSSGIGYACAKKLKTLNYEVFTTARKKEDIQKLKDEGFFCSYLDYTDPSSIEQTLNYMLEKTNGKIDCLFNNGAYGQPGALEDVPREALKEQFETNVFGWHQLVKEVIPIMRKAKSGKIIQNSSILGFVALANRGSYIASKYAIEGLSDTLRLELKGSGIFISLIQPGPIVSNFRKNAIAKFKENIDYKNSIHKEAYKKTLQRESSNHKDPFELKEDAVVKQVINILNAKKPKARYYVTFPTYLFAYLKRILPTSWLDYILKKI